ncbi:ArsR/SmtB family transcription factor [Promicromonospora iranensis]|uniref:DNA-binding transcriptional ArsR family regulator n=1 Tax=Promicromonospora iranensis TaxID=1105144 RepID=A0ABU2CKT8_9MICO|nr:helix-turn-helix domain-containing protein [Promicromonospora iranensis]MDR7381945.1 DNA-binding transcriptional ArsR family regulator [Promicromonospora iranensis]
MAIHITMTTDVLARSRFVVSPAHEVVSAVRLRGRHPAPHARAWYELAACRMDRGLLAVLEALVPDEHDYVSDFLAPPPEPGDTIARQAARIAGTDPAVVDYHLDIGLRGRAVRPGVAAMHGDAARYERWRRPVPPVLAELVACGPEVVARTAAEAVLAFFEAGVACDWPDVAALLAEDIRRRGELVAARGAVAALTSLGPGLTWNGDGVSLARRFEGTVGWAREGLLFVPVTAHDGPVRFTAEEPYTPMLVYRPDGIARLWERQVPPDPAPALAELVGSTRAQLLMVLDEPLSTRDLSRRYHWSEPTVSYHLKVLERSRLVAAERRGRWVLYRQTPLGEQLLGPCEP